jgi:chloramphenicol-sensitive protein RarD
MAVETSLLFLPAAGYLVWLGTRGELVFGHHGAGNASLLMLTGPVTAVPLIMFAAATIRLPLSVVGLLQFLAPVLQFLCGVFVQHESVPAARLGGFLIVWVALAVLTVDAVRAAGGAARSRRGVGAGGERTAVEILPEVAAGSAQA